MRKVGFVVFDSHECVASAFWYLGTLRFLVLLWDMIRAASLFMRLMGSVISKEYLLVILFFINLL